MKNWLLASWIVLLLGACSSPSQPPSQPVLNEEEALFQEIVQSDGQFTSDRRACDTILRTQPWCSVVLGVTQVTRPEWTRLFPLTKFFLVKRNVIGQGAGVRRNWLIAKQGSQRFSVDTFGNLLSANKVVSTDEVREQIAHAFVLMSLPNYLDDEIRFSDWGREDRRSILRVNYNYTITSWTKLQGLKFKWLFIFYEDKFIAAAADPPEYHVGDYMDVPFEVLPLPSSDSLVYWNRN